ncbi:MAG: ribonuclease Z [Candidatus Woesearchaeota archaeon]
MKLTILGTSCMVPTKERNVSATAIEFDGEVILFDCGEGTQRQMNIAKINRQSITKICITHWHADHVAGLMGLLQTIGKKDTEKTLHIYGPIGTKTYLEHLQKSSASVPEIDLHVHELEPHKKPTRFFENTDYALEYISLEHGVPTIGFSFIQKDKRRIMPQKLKEYNIVPGPHLTKIQEGKSITYNEKEFKPDDISYIVPGKKITYALDSAYCEEIVSLAQNAYILITEATYTQKHEENAQKFSHMTSAQAAQVAELAQVEKLILTHISQRYTDLETLEQEAKVLFSHTIIAHDFLVEKF